MVTLHSFEKNDKNKEVKPSEIKKFIYNLCIKSLVVIILFIGSLIYIKSSDDNKENFKNVVYNNSLSFAKIYNVYRKYLGDVIPFKNIFNNNTKIVSDNKLVYNNIEKENNGYILTMTSNYISVINSGIVINIKEDDAYNNLITVQDKTGLNITYGLLSELNVKMYDYVEKNVILGSINNKLYLEFKKDNKYLSYEEYL